MYLLQLSIAYLKERSGNSQSRCSPGEKLHVLSRGRWAVVSPVCNCWLLPPLATEFQIHLQEHSYIGTSSHSFCFPEHLLPSLGYWLFHDSHLNMSVGYLDPSWMGFIPVLEGNFPCEYHKQDRWHRCGLVHTYTYPNATKAIVDNLWLKINKCNKPEHIQFYWILGRRWRETKANGFETFTLWL